MASMSMDTRVRLSTMMFLQYMMLPVWWIPLAQYVMGLPEGGVWKPWIMSSMALGCLASPLIGMFADRHFASQHVLAALNLICGLLLIVAASVTNPLVLFVVLLVAMLCYMPTWGLTSSISMAHSPSEKFPQIRVFGSIGWVAAGVFSVLALWMYKFELDKTNLIFYCGAGTALAAAAFSFFLPHTPPPAKGQKAAVIDVLGLRAFTLFKHIDFVLYVLVSMLVSVAFSMYWSYFSEYMTDKGFKLLTFTQNLGQAAEMVLMLMVPLAIAKVGLKWAMVIGLLAQLARYGSLYLGETTGQIGLSYVAILVHGLIFGFFFVGGQIYVDRRAPKDMKAQAQGFMFLATFGMGLLIGNFLCAWLIDIYKVNGVRQWEPVWMWTTVASAAAAVLFALLFKDTTKAPQAEPAALAGEEAKV